MQIPELEEYLMFLGFSLVIFLLYTTASKAGDVTWN